LTPLSIGKKKPGAVRIAQPHYVVSVTGAIRKLSADFRKVLYNYLKRPESGCGQSALFFSTQRHM
jgi:hypothetical protein